MATEVVPFGRNLSERLPRNPTLPSFNQLEMFGSLPPPDHLQHTGFSDHEQPVQVPGTDEKRNKASRVSVKNLLCEGDSQRQNDISGEDQDEQSSGKSSTREGSPSQSTSKPKRRRWRPSEDALLIRLVSENNGKGWEVIARHFPERTSRQVRLRYVNHLKEGLKSNEVPFTSEEDQFILETQKEYGNRWSKIARMLRGRSDNSVKNRFYTLKRREKRGHSIGSLQ